ncbi:hypothetical protein IscW_ISCW010178, partial [Ixodes scapularis]
GRETPFQVCRTDCSTVWPICSHIQCPPAAPSFKICRCAGPIVGIFDILLLKR